MAIVGFISGYYRCGTTIFQKYVEEVKPEFVVLHEPTQHEIVRHIMAYGWESVNPLHGFPVFKGYSRLRDEVLVEFIRRHYRVFGRSTKHWGVITDPVVAIYLLEPFDLKTDLPIVVKTCQLWPCIDEVAKAFDAWVIHLSRAPDKIVRSHFPDENLLRLARTSGFPPPFYATLVYECLIGDPSDLTAYEIVKQCAEFYVKYVREKYGDRVIDFDDFVLNPSRYEDKIKPIPLDITVHAKIFSPSKL